MHPATTAFLALSLLLLPCCRTERTVVAGPTKTSLSQSFGGSEVDPNSRFQAADPFGYQDNKSGGLNALSGKMFSGSTAEKHMKEFTQTRDFVTRRYSGTRDFSRAEKQSFLQRMSSRFTDASARESGAARESGQSYREGSRSLSTPASREDGRLASTSEYRDGSRMTTTRDFYPAQKADNPRLTEPKMVNAGKAASEKVTSMVMSRPADDPATIDDIRAALGKQ
jgi:hypothetical protein